MISLAIKEASLLITSVILLFIIIMFFTPNLSKVIRLILSVSINETTSRERLPLISIMLSLSPRASIQEIDELAPDLLIFFFLID